MDSPQGLIEMHILVQEVWVSLPIQCPDNASAAFPWTRYTISILHVESLGEEGHSEGGSTASADNISWTLIRILRFPQTCQTRVCIFRSQVIGLPMKLRRVQTALPQVGLYEQPPKVLASQCDLIMQQTVCCL